jgi:hypothetical protein
VLYCQHNAGFCTVGETAVIGQPLFRLLRPDNYRDVALKATDWLAELAGKPKPCPQTKWWNRLIEPVLTDFAESFGAVVAPRMLCETRDLLATLGALPLVCEQRDFGPWNVMITAEGGLAVVDWESSEVHGLPALDLVYFLTYLAFFLDGTLRPHGGLGSGRFRESYRASLAPASFTGGVRSECLTRYANRVGLDPDALRPLRLLVWLIHSRSEYQQFAADMAGRPDRQTLRRSLFLSLWEEELRSLSPGVSYNR